ncbi:MAG: biopolymer transporter ExbD [Chitinophagaceae bacterium]|nr:biopolymer transporter ExbD [Chitinophagaceae bacterium]
MNIRRKLKSHAEVHTGALNDILFILLLFFLIVSTLANPNVMKVDTPRGKNDTKVKQSIVVSIDKNRQMYLQQQPISIDSLEGALQRMITDKTDTPVIALNVDTAAYYGDFFRALNVGKRLKAKVVANINPN